MLRPFAVVAQTEDGTWEKKAVQKDPGFCTRFLWFLDIHTFAPWPFVTQ